MATAKMRETGESHCRAAVETQAAAYALVSRETVEGLPRDAAEEAERLSAQEITEIRQAHDRATEELLATHALALSEAAISHEQNLCEERARLVRGSLEVKSHARFG